MQKSELYHRRVKECGSLIDFVHNKLFKKPFCPRIVVP